MFYWRRKTPQQRGNGRLADALEYQTLRGLGQFEHDVGGALGETGYMQRQIAVAAHQAESDRNLKRRLIRALRRGRATLGEIEPVGLRAGVVVTTHRNPRCARLPVPAHELAESRPLASAIAATKSSMVTAAPSWRSKYRSQPWRKASGPSSV